MTTATINQQSIATTIESAFPFSVDKFPLSGPDGMRTPHYGLFRSDNGDCIGTACKSGYVPHTVDDVATLAEAASSAFEGDSQVRATWHKDRHVVSVIPSLDYRKAIFGTADNIFPRLIIDAGYDGSGYKSSLGLYRDACRNMSMIRRAGAVTSVSIRHTEGMRDRLDDLRETYRTLAAEWTGVVDTVQQMEASTVDLAGFLREVYPIEEEVSRATRTRHDRRIETILHRIIRERAETGRERLNLRGPVTVSAWEAFNGVQGYVQHDMSRRGNPSHFTRAIQSLDDSAVRRAMDLALSA